MSNSTALILKKLKTTGFFSIVISDFLCKAVAFCGGMVLVRVLSKEDYGMYSYIQNTLAILILAADMGTGVATLQYTQENYENAVKRDAYFKYGFRAGMFFSSISVCLILLSPIIFPYSFESAIPLTVSLCAIPYFNMAINFLQIKLRAFLENQKYALLNILSIIIRYAVMLPMSYYLGVRGAVLSNYVINILIVGCAFFLSRSLLSQKANTAVLSQKDKKGFLKLSVASQFNNMLGQFLLIMDVFFIGLFFNDSKTIASYKIASTIPSALLFLPSAIILYSIPYFSRRNGDKQYVKFYFKKLILMVSLICIAISIFFILTAPILIPIFFGSEYEDAVVCFRIIMIGFIFLGGIQIPSQNIIYTQKKVKINIFITVTLGIVNTLGDIVLINLFGSVGAALATALSNILGALLTWCGISFILKQEKQSEILNMYGFVLHIGNKANLNKDTEKLKGGKKINYRNFFCRYNPMPKFEDDKLFLETPELIILLDGVIYNKKELLHRFNENEWGGVFIKLCESSEKFMDELRGPFRGFVYDKKKESLTCFTNHSGEKTIYYYADSDGIVIATHNDLIAEYLKTNGKPCLWNRDTAVELMTVGYALDDHTPMRDVYRLTAGKALRYEVNSQKTDVRRYHFLKNLPEWSMPEEEAMSRFDALYRQAVNRIFSKNEEYGYRHEADLSGGLDTRMVNWVAHDLGYRNFININYCQPGGIDQITASEICEDLGNEFVYYSMEDGEFLKDIDEMTGIYGGQVVYFISTGANRSYARVKEKNIGMAATGLVGEMCNAYWRQGNQHTPPDICVNRMSDILNEPLKASSIQEFDNYEHCNQYLYSYGLFLFSGVIRNQWCEFATPYVDKDFAEFAFRLPLEWRMDYRFYTKWIKTYYPESAKYVWQTKMRPVNRTVYFPRIGWAFQKFGKRIVNKLCRGLNIGFQFTFKDDMNPFNTWYANNGSLRSFMTDYFEDNIGLIADPEIKEKVSKIFAGQGNDKMVALNILAINKRYFRGNDYEEGA